MRTIPENIEATCLIALTSEVQLLREEVAALKKELQDLKSTEIEKQHQGVAADEPAQKTNGGDANGGDANGGIVKDCDAKDDGDAKAEKIDPKLPEYALDGHFVKWVEIHYGMNQEEFLRYWEHRCGEDPEYMAWCRGMYNSWCQETRNSWRLQNAESPWVRNRPRM